MEIKKLLILDDIASSANFIKNEIFVIYGDEITVELLTTEQDFVKQLNEHEAETTLIMVNAAYKPPESESHRYKLNGISRIVKLCLRITWQKFHPVITYDTIPEIKLLKTPIGSIFTFNQNHKYLDIREIGEAKLKDLFKSTYPVADAYELRQIIAEHCTNELAIYMAGINHLLLKIHLLEEECWRKKFINRLECLDHLLFDNQINKLRIRAVIRLLKHFKTENLSKMIKKLNAIRNEIIELKNKNPEVIINVSS